MEHLQNEFFVCQCFSDEHTLRFTFDTEEMEIFTSVFLNAWEPWYKRLWTAIKYFFGYKCKYGHWDSFIMKHEDVSRLRELLDQFEAHVTAKNALKFTVWRERIEEKIAEKVDQEGETGV